MEKLIRNRALCRTCHTILESRFWHDFKMCPCGNFIDGGLEYCRYGGKLEDILLMTEYEEEA